MAQTRQQPDWDLEQVRVLVAEPDARLLVEAPPGAGKTEVACGRVTELIHGGVQPNRILLISFTNAAVQEIRERIEELLPGEDLSTEGLRLRTIDSLAGALRHGYEDDPDFPGYSENLEKFVELLREGDRYLEGFLRDEYRHVIVDEAQDVTGIRREALLELFGRLHPECGITVFGDQAQGIYGWTDESRTADEDAGTENLVGTVRSRSELGFSRIELEEQYRTEVEGLSSFFSTVRKLVTENGTDGQEKYRRVRNHICESYGSGDSLPPDEIPDVVRELRDDSLVLFRTRCALALASSYLSSANVSHRLRHSGMPVAMHPWVAAVFAEYREPRMSEARFGEVWTNLPDEIRRGLQPGECWPILYRLAGTGRDTVNLQILRERLARGRPPEEVLQKEIGDSGPLLSTIHAAKGREAPGVMLLFPGERSQWGDRGDDAWEEEARVLYVASTRPKEDFVAREAPHPYSRVLDERRVSRPLRGNTKKVQLQIGIEGDVDPTFSAGRGLGRFGLSGKKVQDHLLRTVGEKTKVKAKLAHVGNEHRRVLWEEEGELLGALSKQVDYDLWDAGKHYFDSGYKPARDILHLWRVGTHSVVRPEGHSSLSTVESPFRSTGFWLAPLIKGFPSHPFWPKRS